MPKIDTVLPWQKAPNNAGYGKLDMSLVIGGDFGTMTVRRLRPTEPNAGQFMIEHNGNRISENAFAGRHEALAEAERYFYAQPQFAGSTNALKLRTTLQVGGEAFGAGKSIYDNPFARTSIDHAQWASGWLAAYGKPIAEATIATMRQAIEQTTRAGSMLEEDLRTATSRLQAWSVVMEFADTLTGGTPTNSADAHRAWCFITDFRKGDPDLMAEHWPDWCQFLADKNLGPPLANAGETNVEES